METKHLSFQILKSKNNSLHVQLDRQDEYEGYLKRIETIIDKRQCLDKSPIMYIAQKKKVDAISRSHRQLQNKYKIGKENSILLNKLISIKNTKRNTRKNIEQNSFHFNSTRSFIPNFQQRRIRDLAQIHQRNRNLYERITNQISEVKRLDKLNSQGMSSSRVNFDLRHSKISKSLNMRFTNRKLPKLLRKQP